MFSIGKKPKNNQAIVGAIHHAPEVFTNKRRLFVMLAAVAVLIAIGFVGYRQWNHKQTVQQEAQKDCSQKSTPACTVLKDSVPLLDPKKVADLSKKVDIIKTIPGYDKDPNLLYVVTTFYINLSDGANARKYLNLLKAAYNPKPGYDPLLVTVAVTARQPGDLEPTVQYLEKQQQNHSNGYFYGVPPQ